MALDCFGWSIDQAQGRAECPAQPQNCAYHVAIVFGPGLGSGPSTKLRVELSVELRVSELFHCRIVSVFDPESESEPDWPELDRGGSSETV